MEIVCFEFIFYCVWYWGLVFVNRDVGREIFYIGFLFKDISGICVEGLLGSVFRKLEEGVVVIYWVK